MGDKVWPPGHILIIFWDYNQGRIQRGRGDRSSPSEKNDNIFNCYQGISYCEMSKYNSFWKFLLFLNNYDLKIRVKNFYEVWLYKTKIISIAVMHLKKVLKWDIDELLNLQKLWTENLNFIL